MSRSRATLVRAWPRVIALGLVLPLAWWPIASVGAQPPSKKRKDLMDQLGLPKPKADPPKRDDDPPDSPDDREPDGSEPDGSEPGTEPGAPGTAAKPAASKPRITYRGRIRGLFDSGCKSCHATGASAGGTRFTISGDLGADYKSARRLVDLRKPATSVLLTKAAGQGHGGGANYPVGSSNYKTVLEWIEGGALEGAPAKSTAAPAPAPAPAPNQAEPGKPAAPKPGGAAPKAAIAKQPGDESPPTEPEPSWVDPPAPAVAAGPAPIAYAPSVHAILQDRCGSCHAQSAFAGGGALGLAGDPATDYATAVALVDVHDPSASPLLAKARGEAHGGGRSLDVAEPDYRELLAWIEGGALATAPASDDASGSASGSDPGPEVDALSGASKVAVKPGGRLGDGTPVPETGPSRLPFSLPYHLRLNGRFDLSYERRDYKNHPFGPGRNALATYHHFLFLSRSGAKDPFGFNVEVMTQQFFEFNARFKTKNNRAKFLIKAGKILVPFGDEPLYHTSYGGKTGFDQELLPVIWSRPGISFNTHIQAGPISISNDTYAVQGYALRAPDGVLNLQGDFAGIENFQFGVGNRVGLSWAPLTAWYSAQVNPLGHDRLLFMQALDVEFWRLKDVPFLEDLVVGFGAMRADVSGGGEHGGPGRDYYHFGSYGQIRYHPVDWLYMQYRWGLLTFDNRRNLYFDDTRMDERDSSSHNFSVGGTWKGFYAVVQLFWNLEKANEQDNDFLRFTVGYAF